VDEGVPRGPGEEPISLANSLNKEAEINTFPGQITTEPISVPWYIAAQYVAVLAYGDFSIIRTRWSVDEVSRAYNIAALVREFWNIVSIHQVEVIILRDPFRNKTIERIQWMALQPHAVAEVGRVVFQFCHFIAHI